MAKKTGRKKEESLVMVGDGVENEDLDEDLEEELDEEENDEGEEEEESGSRKQKSKSKETDEDGDSDEEDERVGHGDDDEEEDDNRGNRAEKDGNRRESRKARRERQRKARQRNETELNFLRSQNERLEKEVREIKGRQAQSEAGAIDQRINSVQSQLKVADQVWAKAVAAGDEADITEASNIRDRLKDNLTRLNSAKQEMTRRTEEQPEVDSRLVFHASKWMRENNWYDPNGRDKDSRAVAAIDNRLVSEGFNPNTPEYWEELTDRVQSRLPHRFRDSRNGHDDDENSEEEEDRGSRDSRKERRGSGPRFSTGGRERPLKKNEVYVSPERKEAMQAAGVWDDPVLRKRYLKTYKKWDQDNNSGRGGRSAR